MKIKEDTELLPQIFKAEAADRKRIQAEMKQSKEKAEEALSMKKALEERINDLIKERDRKTQLSLQAIAARTDIKKYLDVERNKVKELEADKKHMAIVLEEAENDKAEAIAKHDEMFESVSNLNARIEELESHKIQLLNKLKGYGDKGGLEYIVKTMGIENIQAKDFEGRVEVEHYDP